MAVTLHVDRERWFAHLGATWASYPDIVPVVKGNGYGFGRDRLARLAVDLGADEVAVGTVRELASVPTGPVVVVLAPALSRELQPPVAAVLTVGSERHVAEAAASGFHGAVVIKLATTMRRYGATPQELPGVLRAVRAAGLAVHAFGLHYPLASTSAEHFRAAEQWAARLPSGSTLQVSHIAPPDLARLAAARRDVRIRPRVGSALWHGAKEPLRLTADVLDRREVAAGARVGYRLEPLAASGHLVVASGGTSHGVAPLSDGRSPFHFRRTRLALVEPPHMHASMLFVPKGGPLPDVGDELDLQRPLTQTWVDRIIER